MKRDFLYFSSRTENKYLCVSRAAGGGLKSSKYEEN